MNVGGVVLPKEGRKKLTKNPGTNQIRMKSFVIKGTRTKENDEDRTELPPNIETKRTSLG